MKKIIILFLIMFVYVSCGICEEQVPFKNKDPKINENFKVIYEIADKHIHDGVDSSQLKNVYANGQVKLWQLTATQIKALIPLSVGCLVFNTSDKKVYYSTGTTKGSWAKIKDDTAP